MNVYDRLDRQYQMYMREYKEAAIKVLDSAWYILGEEVKKFERNFADYVGAKYCIGLNSGLDALILAIRALGITKDDEIIVPANTFIATVIGVVENRATAIFVEPDEYYNLDAEKLESSITDKTKAIIVVHLYGQAANMRKIKEIADKYNLYLIEDCAQAHGARFDGKAIGTWGDISCFSFYPTKNLGAFGDSGAVITDNKVIAEKIRMMRNYGSATKYYNEVKGINSRMDEIQAALLSVKLSHINELTQQRQEYAKKYLNGIKNTKIKLPTTREKADHVYHLFVIQCEERDELQKYLLEHGIKTQIHYPIPPHLQKCYANFGYKRGDFEITEYLADHVLSLPLYNGMTDEEIEYTIDIINKYI